MLSKTTSLAVIFLLIAWSGMTMQAQSTGTILGTITDDSGAVIPNAAISITNKATGAVRSLTANSEGIYSAPSLEAGDYEVRCEVQGFRTVVRDATLLAGSNTTVNMTMTIGATQEVVNVEASAAQVNYDNHNIVGVVERQTVQELPLNGRNFLQLSTVEPGIQVAAGATSVRNAPIQVSILGNFPGANSLLTLDGLTIDDELDTGTQLNFTQEMVQEFQMSTTSFDLSAGITAVGAVNIVSRSGGNEFHGSAFYFYRDHNMAAYPALKRNSFNPNPYFSRKNPGAYLGGPIIKDKLFFFFNYEDNNSQQAVTVQPDLPSFAVTAAIYPSPLIYHSLNARFDYRISDKHTMFIRYTHDGNTAFGVNGPVSPPSTWGINNNWSDQSMIAVTSTLTPNLVNDVRSDYRYWRMDTDVPTAAQCVYPCLGAGLPPIGVVADAFTAGEYNFDPQHRIARNFETLDTVTWQKGSHRIRISGDLDTYITFWNWHLCDVGCFNVYSPELTTATLGAANLATFLPNLPKVINSDAALLSLSVSNTASSLLGGIPVGPTFLPAKYHFDSNRRNFRPRWYVQDNWKVTPNLTLNYGMSYAFETGLFNSDLSKPAYLAPIYGGAPGQIIPPTPINWNNFGPVVGFAYSPGKSGKTVIRGGLGLYWDTVPPWEREREANFIGPPGNGLVPLTSQSFVNTVPGIVQQGPNGTFIPLPVGAPIPIIQFSTLTLGEMIQIVKQQIPAIAALISPPNPPTSGPFSISQIDYTKTASELFPPKVQNTRSYQTSIGVQRELGHDMVLSADWARRQAEDTSLGEVDLNHYSEYINGVQTPLIPKCTPSQLFVPGQECSTGGMTNWLYLGRAVYEGMLVKFNKRFSKNYQFLASYALQNQNYDTVLNLNNYMEAYGPRLPRHNLNVSGLINLPFGFELAVNSSILSRVPTVAYTTGVDLSGTNATTSTPIPGMSFDCLGITCGKSALANAVASWNATYAGTKAPNGATIPAYVVPPNYQVDDPTFAQDFRLTKRFTYKEKYRLMIMGEFFNLFNIANLLGYSPYLDRLNPNPAAQTYSYGQPTLRASNTFLSGGPRAIQVGARFQF